MRPITRTTNPRKQGDAGLGLAIGWFASEGWTVCVPLTDSQDYDLVVDNGEGPKRVQVKTTTASPREGYYQASLRTKGGNRSGHTTKFFDECQVDYLFIVTGDGSMYLVPKEEVKGRSTMGLGGKTSTPFRV